MTIDSYEVTKNAISDMTGIPLKNKLPEDLKVRLKTRNQWLEAGMTVKEDAVGYDMHSNMNSCKTYTYFLDTDVEPLGSDVEICANCSLSNIRGFCIVMSSYVSAVGHCSEWQGGEKVEWIP